MEFHFPLMPRMFMALQMEDRFPVLDILDQTPAIPENCQWAIFLRNHDELTLEMVTDEERDYMVRVYAQDPRARINLGIRRRPPRRCSATTPPQDQNSSIRCSSRCPARRSSTTGDEKSAWATTSISATTASRRAHSRCNGRPIRNAGFSQSQPAATLPADDHRPRVPLRVGQRREPAA